MEIRYRYVFEDVDRHGNVRLYFWKRPGRKVRIHEQPGSKAFSERYHELIEGDAAGVPAIAKVTAGTFGWLVQAYVKSVTAKALDPSTLRKRRLILEHCGREPIAPNRPEIFADFPVDRMTTKALRVLRDRKADVVEGANGRVRALRPLFKWALAQEHVRTNVARDLERIRKPSAGWTAWTVDDVAAFEKRHPVGTTARLALAILLFTGMRRSDCVQFGRQHIRDDWISKPQWKNRNVHPQRIEIPLMPALKEVIEASKTGDLAFLVTSFGQPFSIAGFGNWFRERCNEAGLFKLSAHGMRKAGATILAERGATTHQLMAVYGWRSLAEAEIYTRSAERKTLARSGMALMGEVVPTRPPGEDKRAKKRR